MSKEEILEKCCDKRCFLSIDGHPDMRVIDGDANPVLEAMDIHAKNTAIEFAKFAMDKTLQDCNTDEKWTLDDFTEVTTEQLFSLFLQSKTPTTHE